ncbi:hypothetical protein BAUCODRAFT_74097 [Baudoinia panamericana UAMH 10762]|uniref:Uncharacterized protein n=1 Tax=Baudoinia panamericana (strain UAMH 10762) TaxID=717646 RepID=M2MDY0_BAUPA|nr:uncharacterized protein BAUCODRAFT_74097 [Baudoinia panamericana UAMH 10762]EMC94776.1 hypothetical protein BAUCODRAFT_74097 [Baudoinia panamericana UAMH 10762]
MAGPFFQSTPHLPVLSVVLLLILPFAYASSHAFYNIFFHPLRSIPGPLLWRMTKVPYDYYLFTGNLIPKIAELHRQYGPIVRTAPNDLSCTEAEAWEDVFAHHQGKAEWQKNPARQSNPPNGMPNILGADRENHARYRRLLAHAFSEKGLQEQRGTISHYVDLLIDRLRERARRGESTDMVEWYNMTLFDVIGDLAFGASFNSLQDRKQHEWIPAILGNVQSVVVASVFREYGMPWLNRWAVPRRMQQLRVRNFMYAKQKVVERAELGAARGDFWDRILIKSVDDNAGGEGMNQGEMLNNASVLVLGGSETSVTTLSGLTYFLLQNPEKMAMLVKEIRSSFKSDDEIDAFSVARLTYLSGALEETMRLYPPVPFPAARMPSQGEGTMCGLSVPEGVSVQMSQVGIGQRPDYFHLPEQFVPERWLDEPPPEFAGDNRSALQPFVVGTRNASRPRIGIEIRLTDMQCIGRNLAYAEMRLIVAKLLWHFDLEAAAGGVGDAWLQQKAWGLWSKKPLYVRLKDVAS